MPLAAVAVGLAASWSLQTAGMTALAAKGIGLIVTLGFVTIWWMRKARV